MKFKVNLDGIHCNKILKMSFCAKFSLFISVDGDGVLAIWDLAKNECYLHFYFMHFKEEIAYKSIFLTENLTNKINKENFPIEKIRDLSICEENGDFSIISKHYISVYTVNGGFLALERDLERIFSCVLIVQNKDVFEDDYIFTGEKNGRISLWILSQNKNNFNFKDNFSGKIYEKNYYNQIVLPYKLLNVSNFNINIASSIKTPKLEKILISKNQKTLYGFFNNLEILFW